MRCEGARLTNHGIRRRSENGLAGRPDAELGEAHNACARITHRIRILGFAEGRVVGASPAKEFVITFDFLTHFTAREVFVVHHNAISMSGADQLAVDDLTTRIDDYGAFPHDSAASQSWCFTTNRGTAQETD